MPRFWISIGKGQVRECFHCMLELQEIYDKMVDRMKKIRLHSHACTHFIENKMISNLASNSSNPNNFVFQGRHALDKKLDPLL